MQYTICMLFHCIIEIVVILNSLDENLLSVKYQYFLIRYHYYYCGLRLDQNYLDSIQLRVRNIQFFSVNLRCICYISYNVSRENLVFIIRVYVRFVIL